MTDIILTQLDLKYNNVDTFNNVIAFPQFGQIQEFFENMQQGDFS